MSCESLLSLVATTSKKPCNLGRSFGLAGCNVSACGFDKGDGHIIVSMVFSRASEVGNFVWELLERHELIVFDPQADKAYLGDNELPESRQAKKWWQFWK